MFPRGARFPPAKGVIDRAQAFVVSGLILVAVSGVPGPNSYNVNPGLLLQLPMVVLHTGCFTRLPT